MPGFRQQREDRDGHAQRSRSNLAHCQPRRYRSRSHLPGDPSPFVMNTPTNRRSLFMRARNVLGTARDRSAGVNRVQELDSDAGDTLIEVLIALVVLGVTVVAMLLAFG